MEPIFTGVAIKYKLFSVHLGANMYFWNGSLNFCLNFNFLAVSA